MEGVQSQLGYYPQCPQCKSDKGFNINYCSHTTGVSGGVEIVSCKSCKAALGFVYPEVTVHKDN